MGELVLLKILFLNVVLLLEISKGSPIPQDEPDAPQLGPEDESQAQTLIPIMAVQIIPIPALDQQTQEWLNPYLSKIPQYAEKLLNKFTADNESETEQSDENDSEPQDTSDAKESDEGSDESQDKSKETEEKSSEEPKSQEKSDEEQPDKVSDEEDGTSAEQQDKDASETDDKDLVLSSQPPGKYFFMVLQTSSDKDIKAPKASDFDSMFPLIFAPVPEIPLPPQEPAEDNEGYDNSENDQRPLLTFRPLPLPSGPLPPGPLPPLASIPIQEIPLPPFPFLGIFPTVPEPSPPSDCEPMFLMPWKCKQPGSLWRKISSLFG